MRRAIVASNDRVEFLLLVGICFEVQIKDEIELIDIQTVRFSVSAHFCEDASFCEGIT